MSGFIVGLFLGGFRRDGIHNQFIIAGFEDFDQLGNAGHRFVCQNSSVGDVMGIVMVRAGGHDFSVLLRPHISNIIVGIVTGMTVENLDAVQIRGIDGESAETERMGMNGHDTVFAAFFDEVADALYCSTM